MASTTLPLVQSGSFNWTDGSNTYDLHIEQVVAVRQESVQPVTGSSGGTTDTAHAYVHGLPLLEFVGQGFLRKADTTVGLGQSSSIAPGLTVKAQQWAVRRYWPLEEVTGSDANGTPATVKEFSWGFPVDFIDVPNGVIKTGGPNWTDNSVTVATTLNGFGVLSGTLKLEAKRIMAAMGRGGTPRVGYSGYYSGAVSFTAGSDNFAWLYPTAPGNPPRGDLTLNLNTGNNITGKVLLYDFTIQCAATDGGRLPILARFRGDGT